MAAVDIVQQGRNATSAYAFKMTIGEADYAVSRAVVRYGLNDIPYAKVYLFRQTAEEDLGGVYESLKARDSYTPASLEVTLSGPSAADDQESFTGSSVVIFEGFFAGYGPVYQTPGCEIIVWLRHSTFALRTISVHNDLIHTTRLGDPTTKFVQAGITSPLAYFTEEPDNGFIAIKDACNSLLREQRVYGQSVGMHTEALEVIESMQSSNLEPNLLQTESYYAALKRTLLTAQPVENPSLWGSLVAAADEFMFDITFTNINTVKLVPRIGVFEGEANDIYDLTAWGMQYKTGSPDVIGSVAVDLGEYGRPLPFDPASKVHSIATKLVTQKFLRRITAAPAWVADGYTWRGAAARSTVEQTLFVGGVSSQTSITQEDTPNKHGNIDLIAYTEMLTNTTTYRNNEACINGCLRFDINPGTFVIVHAPLQGGRTTQDLDTQYARVQAVSIIIDPLKSDFTTLLELVHVCSETEHESLQVTESSLYSDEAYTGDSLVGE